MGFFSKTCAKTNIPVVASHLSQFNQFSQVVVLYPDGRKITGEYDGYGRVNGIDLLDADTVGFSGKEWDALKFVIQKHYNGEEYGDLGKSGRELGQGFFLTREFLAHCELKGGFKNYAGYKSAYRKMGDSL
jgi:hypothetical protein